MPCLIPACRYHSLGVQCPIHNSPVLASNPSLFDRPNTPLSAAARSPQGAFQSGFSMPQLEGSSLPPVAEGEDLFMRSSSFNSDSSGLQSLVSELDLGSQDSSRFSSVDSVSRYRGGYEGVTFIGLRDRRTSSGFRAPNNYLVIPPIGSNDGLLDSENVSISGMPRGAEINRPGYPRIVVGALDGGTFPDPEVTNVPQLFDSPPLPTVGFYRNN